MGLCGLCSLLAPGEDLLFCLNPFELSVLSPLPEGGFETLVTLPSAGVRNDSLRVRRLADGREELLLGLGMGRGARTGPGWIPWRGVESEAATGPVVELRLVRKVACLHVGERRAHPRVCASCVWRCPGRSLRVAMTSFLTPATRAARADTVHTHT